ncbi:MAG: sugar porter family MFS transporter [Gemmatimonadales bacterium]|nr:sugar porter family MFS transporter [Gemmatimonadales bacterium]NIN13010.1 sugar porter family MFS transporter [Gemmatimonadales bacterium]NIN51087.1 sugar porter family MFS transporter [Gemmatimonadales bacterium]NIP08551.1 sugar porter family MFS transporter [Gemmatimonadales bacterium]NIR02269.1 sugar porter family MFS transporter [Gemmatimonadales bacterium]
MKDKLLFWSVTVALAGFLFGFDTVVISGADQQLQDLWATSDLFHGFVVMSMALWGTVIGAIFGNIPTDRLGRKRALFWIGVLYLVSAVGSAIAFDPYVFSAFRFLGGLGVGASTIAAPAYVSEIAPPDRRGRLVALYQFNIVFGILVAFVSNYLLQGMGEQAWRWMVGVEAVPALVYTLLVLGVPNSPRWLMVSRGDPEGARKILEMVSPGQDATLVLNSMQDDIEGAARRESILQPKYRLPVILAFLIAFFNQLSGINAFLYYAPRIFEGAGLGASTALLNSIGIGLTNLIFTLLGLYLIDRLGRRVLMYIGSVGYIVSLSSVATAFFVGRTGMTVPVFLFVFIAAHAVGQGAVIWVFISEIFPNHLRAKGQSLGSSTHWVLAALITVFMPVVLGDAGNPGMAFAFFAFMMVLQLLFVWRLMPETKGIPLEELEKQLARSPGRAAGDERARGSPA